MKREITVQIDVTLTVSATVTVEADRDEDALTEVHGQLDDRYSHATEALVQEAEAVLRGNKLDWQVSLADLSAQEHADS